MPPNNEILEVQAELLKDEFKKQEGINPEGATREAEKDVKLLTFVLRHRAFFRLFVEHLSSEHKLRELWDRVVHGPERALDGLGADREKYPFRDQAEEFVKNNDPDTYESFTEALEELEDRYDEFSAELKRFIEQTDPEAFSSLEDALEENNMDEADRIIETLGRMHNRTEE